MQVEIAPINNDQPEPKPHPIRDHNPGELAILAGDAMLQGNRLDGSNEPECILLVTNGRTKRYVTCVVVYTGESVEIAVNTKAYRLIGKICVAPEVM